MPIIPRHNVNLSIKALLNLLFNFRLKEKINGNYLQGFQKSFSDYIGVKFSLGVSSARMGLYILLNSLNLQPGDEVILSAYNFHPIPILVKLMGYKAIFVDIKKGFVNIDIERIEEVITSRTKAIIITHMFGYPVNMGKVMDLAGKYKFFVIEDCAHALGATYKGKKVGSFGDAAIFSFSYGKMMPCFGGGMITLKDEELYRKIYHIIRRRRGLSFKDVLTTICFYFFLHKVIFPWTVYPLVRFFPHFIDKKIQEKKFFNLDKFKATKIGMSNLQAKMGLLQLRSLKVYLTKNRINAKNLNKFLEDNGKIELIKDEPESSPAYLYYKLKVNDVNRYRKELLKEGIDTKTDYMSTPGELRPLIEENRRFPNSEEFKNSNIEIPHGPSLDLKDIEYITTTIRNIG